MDLWIRSQNRALLEKAETIKIAHYIKNKKLTNTIVVNNDYIFGEYESKERALEVLDEIQEILKPRTIIKFENRPRYLEDGTISDVLAPKECLDYSKQLINYVYEMPEE